jgi:hypothetical protein
MWRLPRTSGTHIRESWWFELMYTLQGKTRPTHHTLSFSVRVWSSIIRISLGPRIATFCVVINRLEQVHCPREEGLSTQSTARRLTNLWVHIQLLSHNNSWSSGEKLIFCWQPATRFTGPIYQHAIGTFNTCLRGPTHRSLTDTGGDYSLGGASFLHTTP